LQKVRGYVVDGLAYQSLPPEYNGTLRPLVRRVAKQTKQSGTSTTNPLIYSAQHTYVVANTASHV
jgi:hypothetical protein